MAAIKNTIQTKQLLLFVLAVLVLTGAVMNVQKAIDYPRAYILGTALDSGQAVQPQQFSWLSRDDARQKNLAVMVLIAVSKDLSFTERLAMLVEARQLQEAALVKSPAEPYAWLRLSYLRRVTQGNKVGAFDALKMSIAAAPYEPRIMRDRAEAWNELESIQTPEERKHGKEIWRLARKAKDHL